MAYDIFGNDLRRGYCEVHPHVQQEYPCDLCDSERRSHDEKRREQRLSKQQFQSETVRVVIDELAKRIERNQLQSEYLDLDFNGSYMVRIEQNSDSIWSVVNAMNGYGNNCADEFKEYTVTILND